MRNWKAAHYQLKVFVYNIVSWPSPFSEMHTGQQFPCGDTIEVSPDDYFALSVCNPKMGMLYIENDVHQMITAINRMYDVWEAYRQSSLQLAAPGNVLPGQADLPSIHPVDAPDAEDPDA